jgi:hypothetical protein
MATTLASGESIECLCELGFIVREFTLNTSTLNGTDVLDGTLEGVDVSPYLYSATVSRGRTNQFDPVKAGVCELVLNNNDRRFDPINTSSPYYDSTTGRSGVVPRRKVTLYSATNHLFTGRILDVDVIYDVDGTSQVVLTCADDFNLLGSVYFSSDVTPTSQLSGARVTAILDRTDVNYPVSTRSIATGTQTLGTQQINQGTTALAYLQKVAETEQGLFYVAADGTLTFTDRSTNTFAAPAVTFSDAGTVGTAKYTALSVIYGSDFLYNRVQITRDGGTTQNATDSASIAEFGTSTLDFSNMLFNDDSQASTLATYLLNLYKEPEYRFDDVAVPAHALTNTVRNTVNSLELGDIVAVVKSYVTGTPATVTQEYEVGGVQHRITPSTHEVVFRIRPAQIVYAFVLNDATRGVLDADNALT